MKRHRFLSTPGNLGKPMDREPTISAGDWAALAALAVAALVLWFAGSVSAADSPKSAVDPAPKESKTVKQKTFKTTLSDLRVAGSWTSVKPETAPQGKFYVLDIAPSGHLVTGAAVGEGGTVLGRMTVKDGQFMIRYTNGKSLSGTLSVDDDSLVLKNGNRSFSWTRQSKISKLAVLASIEIKAPFAKVNDLRKIADRAARNWHAKAALKKIEVRSMNADGTINLIKTAGQVLFYYEGDKRNHGAIVTIGQWGKPSLWAAPTAIGSFGYSIPDVKLKDLTEIIAKAREHGYDYKISHATLQGYRKHNRRWHEAWVLRSNEGASKLDPIFCIDRWGRTLLFTNELFNHDTNHAFGNTSSEAHLAWLRAPTMRTGYMRFAPSGTVTIHNKGKDGKDRPIIICEDFFHVVDSRDRIAYTRPQGTLESQSARAAVY